MADDRARDFLADYHGSPEAYDHLRALGQRQGQAFYNSLHVNHARVLNGRDEDPFYDDTKIQDAIGFLLHMEELWEEDRARAKTAHD